jgi:hypothetical protein
MHLLRGPIPRILTLTAGFLLFIPAAFAYSFPLLGVTEPERTALEMGFSLQWALFGSLAGTNGSAFYYLALAAALVGALLMVFNKKNHNITTAACWLLMVILMLFAPYKSRLLFYPLDGHSECMASTNISLSENGVCGFMPQMVALHLGSVLHIMYYDLLNSAGLQNAVECGMARARIADNRLMYGGGAAQSILQDFHKRCGDDPPALLSDETRERYATGAENTFGEIVEEIKAGYEHTGRDDFPKPAIALVRDPSEAAGWNSDRRSDQWQRYVRGVEYLYRNLAGGAGDIVADPPTGAVPNEVSLSEAIDSIEAALEGYNTNLPDSISHFLFVADGGAVPDTSRVIAGRKDARCDNKVNFDYGTATACPGSIPDEAAMELRNRIFNEAETNSVLQNMPVLKANFQKNCGSSDSAVAGGSCSVTASVYASGGCAELADQTVKDLCADALGETSVSSAAHTGVCAKLTDPDAGKTVCADILSNPDETANPYVRELCQASQACGESSLEGEDMLAMMVDGVSTRVFSPNNPMISDVGKDLGSVNPKTLGWWGGFAGGIASFASKVLVDLGSFFSGATAVAFISIMRHLINLMMVAIPIVTPIFFIMGLIIPGNAMGLFFLSVMGMFVIKLVPVTWLIIDFIATVVSGGLKATESTTEQSLLLFGVAGLYLSSVGLTLFILFKIGDPGNLSALAKLDNAAKEAAEAGNRLTNGALTMVAALAAAVATGGVSGAAQAIAAQGRKAARKAGVDLPPSGTGGRGPNDTPPGTATEEGDPNDRGPNTGGDGAETTSEEVGADDWDTLTPAEQEERLAQGINDQAGGIYGAQSVREAMGQADADGNISVYNPQTGEMDTVNMNDARANLGGVSTPLDAHVQTFEKHQQAQAMEAGKEILEGQSPYGLEGVSYSSTTRDQELPPPPQEPEYERDEDGLPVVGGKQPTAPDQQQAATVTGQPGQTAVAQSSVAGQGVADQTPASGQASTTAPAANTATAAGTGPAAATVVGSAPAADNLSADKISTQKLENEKSSGDIERVAEKTTEKTTSPTESNVPPADAAVKVSSATVDKQAEAPQMEVDGVVRVPSVKAEELTFEQSAKIRHAELEGASARDKGDNALVAAEEKQGADRWMEETGFFKRAGMGAFSGAVGYLQASSGLLTSLPVVGNAIKEVLNERTQADVRVAGWAARGGSTDLGGLWQGFRQRSRDADQAERGAHWQQELSQMSAADSFTALQDGRAMQGQVNIARQSANQAAATTRSQYEVMAAKQEEIQLAESINNRVRGMSASQREAYDKSPQIQREVEIQAFHDVKGNFQLKDAVFSTADLKGVGTLSATQNINQLQVDAAMMQGGVMGTYNYVDENGKEQVGKVDVGTRTLGMLANAQAAKGYSGQLDQMLLNHYKVREKQIRGGSGQAIRPGGSKADIQSYIDRDIGADYESFAIQDIVFKKEMFREIEGKARALKQRKVEEVQLKPQMRAEMQAKIASEMAQIKIDNPNLSQAQVSRMENELEKKYDAEMKLNLPLERIHVVASNKGYQSVMSQTRMAVADDANNMKDIYDKELKSLKKLYGGSGNLSSKHFQPFRMVGKDNVRADLDSFTDEFSTILMDNLGENRAEVMKQVRDKLENQDIDKMFSLERNAKKGHQVYRATGAIAQLRSINDAKLNKILDAMERNNGKFVETSVKGEGGYADGFDSTNSGIPKYVTISSDDE